MIVGQAKIDAISLQQQYKMKQDRPDIFAYLPGARFVIPAGERKHFRRLCRGRDIEIGTFYGGNKAWVRHNDNDSAYDDLVEAGFERLTPFR